MGGRTEREDQEFGFGHSRSDMPMRYPCGDVQSRRRSGWYYSAPKAKRLDEVTDGEELRSIAEPFSSKRKDTITILVSWGEVEEGNKARVTSVFGYSEDRQLGWKAPENGPMA